MPDESSARYAERLWPSPGVLITLLLIIPAALLTVSPVNAAIAPFIAVALYVLIAATLLLAAPTIRVTDGVLQAANARVPVSLLGEVELLNTAQLRRVIGPEADARAYLLVRGYIRQGVRITLNDDKDPTPYWVLTTRRPRELAAALEAAKGSAR